MRLGCVTSKQHSGRPLRVALLTGGGDKHYAVGLASALLSQGIPLDFIGSDEVDAPELHATPLLRFLNLRGDQRQQATFVKKAKRVLSYYIRLIRYATISEPTVFHVLWNNKFELFDRIILMLYYRLLGKSIALTAHNVNSRSRDSRDSFLNRITLRCQYKLTHHIFVHTSRAKTELLDGYDVPDGKVSVIPYGINNVVPNSEVTPLEAKRLLGLTANEKTMLFFGNIAPYKGLEYLVTAMATVAGKSTDYRLIIAGRPKRCGDYWKKLQDTMMRKRIRERVIECIEYIADERIELYFKAADVVMLPYVTIYQSGVLFLAYNFGLPVIAADVGSLKDYIIPGETGLVCRAADPADLARTIDLYFKSELYRDLKTRRKAIQNYAREEYSWSRVGKLTAAVYDRLGN